MTQPALPCATPPPRRNPFAQAQTLHIITGSRAICNRGHTFWTYDTVPLSNHGT